MALSSKRDLRWHPKCVTAFDPLGGSMKNNNGFTYYGKLKTGDRASILSAWVKDGTHTVEVIDRGQYLVVQVNKYSIEAACINPPSLLVEPLFTLEEITEFKFVHKD
jgi:hypothetical protein